METGEEKSNLYPIETRYISNDVRESNFQLEVKKL